MKNHRSSKVPSLVAGLVAAANGIVSAQVVVPETASFTAPDAQVHALFGWSAALDGSTAVFGALEASAPVGQGAAYVYTESGGAWSLQAKLVAQNPTYGFTFGWAVDVEGDRVVVGAPYEDLQGGAAYVFERTGGVWDTGTRIALGGAFGTSVAIEGQSVFVGTLYDDRVYVLHKQFLGWSVAQILTPSISSSGQHFGTSIDVDGDTLIVGASHSTQVGPFTGRAFVFTFDGAQWTEQAILQAADPTSLTYFGDRVAISGDLAAVGAPASNFPPLGSVYVFERSGSIWTQEAKLPSVANDPIDRFGSALDISDGAVLAGAHIENGSTGAAYEFRELGGAWSLTARLVPTDGGGGDLFGFAIECDGGRALVGAPYKFAGFADAGRGYLFDFGGTRLVAPPDVVAIWNGGPSVQADPNVTGWASFVDACDPNPVLSYSDALQPGVLPGEPETIVTRTWRLTDACGADISSLQRITLLSPSGGGGLHFDISPGSCPNEVAIFAGGTSSFSVVSTPVLDSALVEPTSLRLRRADGIGGTLRSNDFAALDLSSPFYFGPPACQSSGGDGRVDLGFTVPTTLVRRKLALAALADGTVVEVVLTARLLDGTPIEARDSLVVRR